MEPEKVNRWLTLGANFGVLIGIILLVVELDQNRDMIRAQARNDISRHVSDHLAVLGSNRELASLMRRAEADEELTEVEAAQHFYMFTSNKRMWENIHYQYRIGLFEEEEFEAERTAWRFLINKDKSFARIWCATRRNYSPEFITELETLFDGDACKDAEN